MHTDAPHSQDGTVTKPSDYDYMTGLIGIEEVESFLLHLGFVPSCQATSPSYQKSSPWMPMTTSCPVGCSCEIPSCNGWFVNAVFLHALAAPLPGHPLTAVLVEYFL